MASRQEAMKALGLGANPSEAEVKAFYDRLNRPGQDSSSNTAVRGPQEGHTGHSFDQVVQDDNDDEDSDEYEDDEYESDEEYESDSEYVHMPYRGQMDANGNYVVDDGGGPDEAQDNCYCPRCTAIRKAAKQQDKAAKLEAARRRKALRDAERAEAAAKEEEDRHMQKVDPKNSLAWKRGGESREKLIREHFLAQMPQLLLHWAGSESLIVLLDVPDVSLLTEAKLPPKGVDWEVSFRPEAGSKWANIVATKEYDNISITKLLSGTTYVVKCRTGLSGNLTWSGAIEWGPWSANQQYKTTGTPPATAPQQQSSAAAAAGKSGGKKKKKNRDAAFAKLTRQADEQAAAEDEQPEDGVNSDVKSEGEAAGDPAASLELDTESDGDAKDTANGANGAAAAPADELTADEAAAAAFFGIKAAAAPAAAPAPAAAAKKGGKKAAAGSKPGLNALKAGKQAAGSKQAGGNVSPAATAATVAEQRAGAAESGTGDSSSHSKHKPTSNSVCKFFAQGKCAFGSNCRFVHERPVSHPCDDEFADSAAAGDGDSSIGEDSAAVLSAAGTADDGTEAAAAAKRDRAALERLLPCTITGPHIGLKAAREVVKITARLSARVPVARYQPAPVTAEGLYLKPLFLSAYDVTESGYAAWYRHLEASASSSQAAGCVQPRIQSKPAAATVKARLAEAMKDQQQLADLPAAAAPPAPAVAAAAPAPAQQQQQPISSTSGGQGGHKPKFSSTCKFFAQGTCKFGSSCAFVHPSTTSGSAAPPMPAAAPEPAAVVPSSSAWYDSGPAAAAGGSYDQYSVSLQQPPQQHPAHLAGQISSLHGTAAHVMPGALLQQQAAPAAGYVQQHPNMSYQQQGHDNEQEYGQQQFGQQQYTQQQYGQQQPPYQPSMQQQQPSLYASYTQSIPPAGPYDPYRF